MIADTQTKKIFIASNEDYKNIIYFIQRDSRSDKKFKSVGRNTIVVNNSTARLLSEIGIHFSIEDCIERELK